MRRVREETTGHSLKSLVAIYARVAQRYALAARTGVALHGINLNLEYLRWMDSSSILGARFDYARLAQ